MAEGARVSLGQPNQLTQRSTSVAFSRLAHVVGFVCLSGAFVSVAAYQQEDPTRTLWPALVAVAVMAASLWLLYRNRTLFRSLAYLALGGASVYSYSLSIFSEIDSINSTDAFLIALAKTALVLLGGRGRGALSIVLWCCAGYLVAQAAAFAAAAQAGATLRPDATAIVLLGLLVAAVVFLIQARRSVGRAQPKLQRAVLDEHVSVLRRRFELKAATMLHDTVLNHLTAISGATKGFLRADLRLQIERNLEQLLGEQWLSEPEDPGAPTGGWRKSALHTAVAEARQLGLIVDLSGDLDAVDRLDAECDTAAGLATKQCLVNVSRHSGTERAEVAVFATESDISVMIVDDGRGFAEGSVGADRLGLRQSVRERIEDVGGEVQVWSAPGRGTSVLIRVPTLVAMQGGRDGG